MDNAIFSKYEADGRQTVWDPSSISSLLRCPQHYQYNNVQRLAKVRESTSMVMPRVWGTCWHKGIETYEIARFDGLDWELALDSAILAAADEYKRLPFAAEASSESSRNLDTLMRAVIWYCLQYKDDELRTLRLPDGKPALEVRFEVPIPGTEWRLSGRIDRVTENADGEILVVDHKTTTLTIGEDYYQSFTPNIQFPMYYWGLRQFLGKRVKGVVINACQTAVRFTRYGRHLITYTDAQLEEYFAEMVEILKTAASYHRDGQWPRNSMGCSLWGGCPYRRLCSATPENRKAILEDEYLVRP